MSRLNNFQIDISLDTVAETADEFGGFLIYETDTEKALTIYADLPEVLVDFQITTETYKLAAKVFNKKPKPKKIAIMGSAAPTVVDIIADLDTVKTKDWFCLMCTDNANATAVALAEWATENDKVYAATSQDLTLFSTVTDENAWIGFHSSADAYLAEDVMAMMLVNDIGSIDPFLKTFDGIPEATITDPQLIALHAANGFTYIKDHGALVLTESKTASGEYLDVVLGKYWIKFTMEQRMFELAQKTKKIGYSNKGIASLIDIVANTLKEAADMGIVLKDDSGNPVFTYTYKKREETSKEDRAKRTYNDLSWHADLLGSIHNAKIGGVLSA